MTGRLWCPECQETVIDTGLARCAWCGNEFDAPAPEVPKVKAGDLIVREETRAPQKQTTIAVSEASQQEVGEAA